MVLSVDGAGRIRARSRSRATASSGPRPRRPWTGRTRRPIPVAMTTRPGPTAVLDGGHHLPLPGERAQQRGHWADPSVSRPRARRGRRRRLRAAATYPLKAHRWPSAMAPTSHTWAAHDAAVQAGRGRGRGPAGAAGTGCCASARGLAGPYWLPAASVTVTGAVTDVPQAPGVPGDFGTTDLQGRVVLGWTCADHGRARDRLPPVAAGRARGPASVLTDDVLDGGRARGHTDTNVTAGTTYRYRLQAQSADGPRGAHGGAGRRGRGGPARAAGGARRRWWWRRWRPGTAQLFWEPVAEATGYDGGGAAVVAFRRRPRLRVGGGAGDGDLHAADRGRRARPR